MDSSDSGVGREVVLVWPTGEAHDRAMRAALDWRGTDRTPDEDAQFVELCRRFRHPDMTIGVLESYLRLCALGCERTDDEETEYRVIGSRYGFDGASLTPEKVNQLEEKAERGEPLDMAETIARDAAIRRARPQSRHERRRMRGRPLAQRVFRRRPTPVARPTARHRPRTSRVFVALVLARAPGRRCEPAEPQLAVPRLRGAR